MSQTKIEQITFYNFHLGLMEIKNFLSVENFNDLIKLLQNNIDEIENNKRAMNKKEDFMNKYDKKTMNFLNIENEKMDFNTTMNFLNNLVILGLACGAGMYLWKYPNKIINPIPEFNKASGIFLINISIMKTIE